MENTAALETGIPWCKKIIVYLHIKCQVFEVSGQFTARADNGNSPGIYFNSNTLLNFDGLRHQNLLHLCGLYQEQQ